MWVQLIRGNDNLDCDVTLWSIAVILEFESMNVARLSIGWVIGRIVGRVYL
jgi:hypothetical protein